MSSLALTTLLPLAGALVALVLPSNNQRFFRGFGIAVALATFLQSLLVLFAFKSGQGGFQLETNWAWVPALGIRFHLGIDGISLWLVLLSTLMVLVTLLSPQATGFVRDRNRGLMAAMLMLESGMIGAFLALDMFADPYNDFRDLTDFARHLLKNKQLARLTMNDSPHSEE